MVMTNADKVLCQTPTPGKKPTRIDKWKYELVREAILQALPSQGTGVAFKELPDKVASYVDKDLRSKLGSISWYTTCVKLDMEVKGEIKRIAGSVPQRLLRS